MKTLIKLNVAVLLVASLSGLAISNAVAEPATFEIKPMTNSLHLDWKEKAKGETFNACPYPYTEVCSWNNTGGFGTQVCRCL